MSRKRLGLDQGARDPLAIKPSLRFSVVAHGRAGEPKSRHAGGEPAREHAADGAEAGNGDACRRDH
jgi:hypothetical protein